MRYADQPLSQLAINIPQATALFRRNRLDFCCGGKQTLREACAHRSLSLIEMEVELDQLEARPDTSFEGKSLTEMVDFIEVRYHQDLRQRIPELITLSSKVEQVHSEHSACPRGLTSFLIVIQDELETHMKKEENVLFPMIRSGKGQMAVMPVKVMNLEHDSHGRQLDELHLMTDDFTPPDGACGTWRALYAGLEKLEEELMAHIHLENNVVFPRALKGD